MTLAGKKCASTPLSPLPPVSPFSCRPKLSVWVHSEPILMSWPVDARVYMLLLSLVYCLCAPSPSGYRDAFWRHILFAAPPQGLTPAFSFPAHTQHFQAKGLLRSREGVLIKGWEERYTHACVRLFKVFLGTYAVIVLAMWTTKRGENQKSTLEFVATSLEHRVD